MEMILLEYCAFNELHSSAHFRVLRGSQQKMIFLASPYFTSQ